MSIKEALRALLELKKIKDFGGKTSDLRILRKRLYRKYLSDFGWANTIALAGSLIIMVIIYIILGLFNTDFRASVSVVYFLFFVFSYWSIYKQFEPDNELLDKLLRKFNEDDNARG